MKEMPTKRPPPPWKKGDGTPGVERPQRAWLLSAAPGEAPEALVEESLRELEALAKTAGAETAGRTACRLRAIQPATYIGKGKAEEVAEACRGNGVDLVLFDDDLSPAQGQNLGALLGVPVVDRTQLILDIFAQRARTVEGRLQVELAQLQYALPRLRGLWTHLERQKGGIGLKGPGEKQLELDRRRIGQRIHRIGELLEDVRRHRAEIRQGRRRHGWAQVALVGYTNAGKSTLLNRLGASEVLADDLLFATLDPTTRAIRLPNRQRCLLTDTVGFIRKLPHHLVEAFKATLEEVREADLLLHVVDCSHPFADEQVEAVEHVLAELGAGGKPVLALLNKTDLERGWNQATRLADRFAHWVRISARTGEGVAAMLEEVADALNGGMARLRLRLPAGEGKGLARLHAAGHVLSQKFRGGYVYLEVSLPKAAAAALPKDWVRGEG